MMMNKKIFIYIFLFVVIIAFGSITYQKIINFVETKNKLENQITTYKNSITEYENKLAKRAINIKKLQDENEILKGQIDINADTTNINITFDPDSLSFVEIINKDSTSLETPAIINEPIDEVSSNDNEFIKFPYTKENKRVKIIGKFYFKINNYKESFQEMKIINKPLVFNYAFLKNDKNIIEMKIWANNESINIKKFNIDAEMNKLYFNKIHNNKKDVYKWYDRFLIGVGVGYNFKGEILPYIGINYGISFREIKENF